LLTKVRNMRLSIIVVLVMISVLGIAQEKVKIPSTDWYMISPDSFLLAHLPSNPMWQLKKDTIS